MERPASPSSPPVPGDGAGLDDASALSDEPALRDAAEILARAMADEAAADEARDRYRTEPLATFAPDARVAPLLGSGECLVAVRRSAVFDRRQPVLGSDVPTGLGGDLYLTTRRLILIGRLTLAFELDEIEDAMLSGERLLLVMKGGQGLSLDVAWPRLLRVEIAAARVSSRT